MNAIASRHAWRQLAGPSGDGLNPYLTDDGAFIGDGVPLLEKTADGRFQVRAPEVLEVLLRIGYGGPVEMSGPLRSLSHVAKCLNAGDVGQAHVALAITGFAPLASLAHARAMREADELRKNWVDEARDSFGRWVAQLMGGVAAKPKTESTRPVVAATKAGASGANKRVQIRHPDGSVEIRTAGTRAWRNNNSGNMRYGPNALKFGAVGKDAQGFAIFPDAASGATAQRKLLLSDAYKNLSVDDVVAKWAPKKENNTALYQANVRKWTGLSGSERIGDLSSAQLQSFMVAQRKMEGFKPGGVTWGGASPAHTPVPASSSQTPKIDFGEAVGPIGSSAALWVKPGKDGANISNLHPELVSKFRDIADVLDAAGAPHPVITSGNDGKHKTNSKHYKDDAIDIRGHDLSPAEGQRIAADLQQRLGRDFFVQFEVFPKNPTRNHIHIQYNR